MVRLPKNIQWWWSPQKPLNTLTHSQTTEYRATQLLSSIQFKLSHAMPESELKDGSSPTSHHHLCCKCCWEALYLVNCRRRWLDVLHEKQHWPYLKGFSPVCLRLWLYISLAWMAEKLQRLHLNCFQKPWMMDEVSEKSLKSGTADGSKKRTEKVIWQSDQKPSITSF